jgi:hypothetical protein
MRIIHLLKIEDGNLEIVESFPVVDEQLSAETIQVAEDVLFATLLGPKYEEVNSYKDLHEVVTHAYTTGVSDAQGERSFYLLWSTIPD